MITRCDSVGGRSVRSVSAPRLLWFGVLTVSCTCRLAVLAAPDQKTGTRKPASGKELATKDVVIPAGNWDEPFRPVPSLFGSYSSFVRKGKTVEVWNNTIGDGPDDGIVRFTGPSPVEFGKPQVVIPHRIIDDVLDKDGALSSKRRYTRPSIVWDPEAGYFAVAHVCDGYPPRDGRVYPAFLSSKSGAAGTWTYHGRLKGEIYEAYGPGPGKQARWADGRGLVYQPEKPADVNHEAPLENRFLFFSNQYPGSGCLALLYAADAAGDWHFLRRDGEIVNLLPDALRGKSMIFPHVVRAGAHGWFCWISEKWPPIATWRLHSADGLTWQLFGTNQPEITKPDDVTMKNLSAWYDADQDVINGYIGIWTDIGDGVQNYRNYHSVTRP